MSNPIIDGSKFLSFVLRHKPEAIGLMLDSEGWADIEQLIDCAKQSGRTMTRQQIDVIVKTNDKKRFSYSDDGHRIRAAQGHSTKSVAIEHVQKHPPEILFHGTATRNLDSIQKKGLLAGSRHYVHLSEDEKTAIAVGSRYGKPVVLLVQAQLMASQCFKFYQADNGVWLTQSVPAAYLQLR